MLGTAVIDVGVAAEKKKIMLDCYKGEPPDPLKWQPWFDELLIPIIPQLEFLHQQIDVDEEIIEPFRAVVRAVGSWNSVRFQIRNDGFTKAIDIWNQEWRMLDQALADVRNSVVVVSEQYLPAEADTLPK